MEIKVKQFFISKQIVLGFLKCSELMTHQLVKNIKNTAIKKVSQFSRPITTKLILNNILKLTSNNVDILSLLINKGHSISGFVPYFKNKTSIILGNFLSINYGIRKEINVIVGLLDSNFNVKAAKLYKQNLREILIIKDSDFIDFNGNQDGSEYCIVCAISPAINFNHGGSGGNLRFWGVWSEFSAYVHSSALPSPICFLRKNMNKLKGVLSDRMTYPSIADRVLHFGPLEKTHEFEQRGDLSGKVNTQYGYSILLDEDSKITSCFHTSSFQRDRMRDKGFEEIIHVVPLPPVEDYDIDLFFGEACSSGSKFIASLWQKDNPCAPAQRIENKELTVKCDVSVLASSLFNTNISSQTEKWITFKPISGKHANGYISLVFRNKANNKCLDGVHSQSFKQPKLYSRALKFCPFPFSIVSNQCSFLTIYGSWEKDVKVRLRIFSVEDPGFEILFAENIKSQEVKYINLIDKLPDDKKFVNISQTYVCQLESEEANLDAYLFNISSKKERIEKLSVDHFTGG